MQLIGHPVQLWLVRHAQSAGNVANDAALAAGSHELDLAIRDMDVPLSDLGERQAKALSTWLQGLDQPPDVVWCSPYKRALDTAHTAMAAAGIEAPTVCDERLREREFGVLDRLTKAGIQERFPDQMEFRKFLGKFYHRPPGGESWADVAFRVRAVADELSLHYEGERVLIVSHQVVILMFRYVLERFGERDILDIDKEHELANCSITSYELSKDGHPELRCFNETAPMEDEDEPVTAEPDVVEEQS